MKRGFESILNNGCTIPTTLQLLFGLIKLQIYKKKIVKINNFQVIVFVSCYYRIKPLFSVIF